jgi:glycosidase
VEAVHKQHMKFFFDAAPNHVGPTNPWVKHPPLADWFHGSPEHHLTAASPLKPSFYGQAEKRSAGSEAFEELVDPHTSPQILKNVTEGWIGGVLPDLNTENPMVLQYLEENSVWWAETSGLDGLGIAEVPYVSRRFLEQWHADLRKLYPRLSTIGEVAHTDPAVTSFYQGGRPGWDGVDTQLTSVFDYPLNSALREVLLNGAPVGKITNVLREDALYPHPDFLVTFFDNPDAARIAGQPEGTPAHLKLACGLILTARGIPDLYYGDELGMPGGSDADNRRDFPGGWPDDAKNAFKKEGRTAQQEVIFEYVQSLLRLRAQHPALRRGKLWSLASDDTTYVFLRESDEERVLVAFNAGGKAQDLSLPLTGTEAQDAANALAIFGEGQVDLAGRTVKLHLPAESLSVFSLQ